MAEQFLRAKKIQPPRAATLVLNPNSNKKTLAKENKLHFNYLGLKFEAQRLPGDLRPE